MMDTKKSTGADKLTGVKKVFMNWALLLGLIGIVAIFSLITQNFFSISNLMLVLQQSSIVGIAACAMTFVIITGNFDLSMGATITTAVLLSVDLHDKLGTLPAVLIAVAACLIVGLINGYIVGYIKVNSMIITLGTMMILKGAILLYTGGQLSWVASPKTTWFQFFGRADVLGIPMQVLLLAMCVILFEFVLKRTTFGVKIQAAGGNASALRYSGTDDRKIVLIAFVLSALMSALAGLIMGSRTMKFQQEIAFGYEFDVISAVILGGASLTGGSGSVVKTLIGVVILTVLQNGFLMIGLSYYFQWLVQGIVILFMVFIDVTAKRKEGLA